MNARCRWLSGCCVALLTTIAALAAEKPTPGPVVPFRTERAGVVSINLYGSEGQLVRRLVQSQRFAAGAQKAAWDGRGDDGQPVPPGEYTWKGLFNEGIGLKLRGWVGNGAATPWPTPDGKEIWGGDTGVPSAVAADAQKVYLGWSMADQGKSILACDLEGRVQWSHRRAEGPSGCRALCVDDGLLYVLGGLEGGGAEGGAIYRLNAKTGQPVPWPDGKLDLFILNLWPPDSTAKPSKADAMAVRHGHMYLTFTQSEFMAVLDARTGAYLQTVVGAPPGQIDVVATKTDLPDAPGKLVDADFAVISLGGGVFGKVLFAHDPLWVVTSEMEAVKRDVSITALTAIGDGGKFRRHDVFIGLGRPFHQVQARPLLDSDSVTWVAGKPGGRPLLGPWEPNALRDIRGLALAADGKLWVAEADEFPKRFSVWDTSGEKGTLVREFFGPAKSGEWDGAINPLDPDLMFAQGCEWRVDRKTGRATCLGVVVRDSVDARYAVGENGHAYLVTRAEKGVAIFERLGDGDYKLRARFHAPRSDPATGELLGAAFGKGRTIVWADENGDGEVQAGEEKSVDEELRIFPSMTMQDLTLSALALPEGGRVLKVQSWSPCGAPRYNLSKPIPWPQRAWLSADYRCALSFPSPEASGPHQLVCRSFPDGADRWKTVVPRHSWLTTGSALMPSPIGNVWLMFHPNPENSFPVGGVQKKLVGVETWTLINEDGFEIARLFAGDEKKIRWPSAAAPGADMSNAVAGSEGQLIQAADGKLYLQAGAAAAWNLEVTGLDKARALPGGKVIVPARK